MSTPETEPAGILAGLITVVGTQAAASSSDLLPDNAVRAEASPEAQKLVGAIHERGNVLASEAEWRTCSKAVPYTSAAHRAAATLKELVRLGYARVFWTTGAKAAPRRVELTAAAAAALPRDHDCGQEGCPAPIAQAVVNRHVTTQEAATSYSPHQCSLVGEIHSMHGNRVEAGQVWEVARKYRLHEVPRAIRQFFDRLAADGYAVVVRRPKGTQSPKSVELTAKAIALLPSGHRCDGVVCRVPTLPAPPPAEPPSTQASADA